MEERPLYELFMHSLGKFYVISFPIRTMTNAGYACSICLVIISTAYGQNTTQVVAERLSGQEESHNAPEITAPRWEYGAFLDAAYLLDFNHPANDLFRSRGTAYKLNQPLVNMAAVYFEKNASESSPWGMQLTVQAGQDTRIFG